MKIVIVFLLVFGIFLCARETTIAAPEMRTVFVREDADVRRETDERSLRALVAQDMDICGAPTLSEARRKIVAEQIVRVAMSHDVPVEYRESFVGLICLESRFNPDAKSSAGAIGLTQIMPQYAQHFADMCSMGKLAAQDVADPETNLRLGACLFFSLLDHFHGNRVLAGAAFNSGQDSKTTKAIAALSTGHPETNGWITKFFALEEQRRVRDHK